MSHRPTPPPDATPFERRLLASWGEEQPSDAARKRALVLAGALGAATASQAGGASKAAVAKGATGVALPSFVSATVAKWLVLASFCASAVALSVGTVGARRGPAVLLSASVTNAAPRAGEAEWASPSASSDAIAEMPLASAAVPSQGAPSSFAPDAPRRTSPSARAPRTPGVGRTSPAASAIATPAPTALPPASDRDDAHDDLASASAPTASAQPPVSGLQAQLSAIDDARAALARGGAAEALRLVDAYDAKFDAPLFAQEATVLRVEALVRADPVAARRVGDGFLARWPNSPHATKVRSLLYGITLR